MISPKDFERFLPHLSTRQLQELKDKDRTVIIQPLAAVEQHGPHLPLYTDSLIVQEVLWRALGRLPEDFPAWTLPLLAYGKSTEHLDFPGTISLTAETLIQVLKEIAHSLARSAFQRLVILNAHGGNTEIVDFLLRDIRVETGMMAFAIHPFLRVGVPEEGLSEQERIFGIHAGDIETSILLASYPHLVRDELLPSSVPVQLQKLDHPPFMGPLNFGWVTDDLSEDGVLGDATTADAERGEAYLEAAATQTSELLEKAQAFSFE